MKKNKLLSILVLGCVLSFPFVSHAQSSEDIHNKIDEISAKYKIGEKMSEEDINYILEHSHKVDSDSTRSLTASAANTYSIAGSKVTSNREVEGEVLGDFTANIGFINHSVTGHMKTYTVKGVTTKATASFNFKAYGAISTESPYVGKVADFTQTASGNQSASLDISKTFIGNVVAWNATAEGTLKYPNGTMNITGYQN